MRPRSHSSRSALTAIILAAGEGTRMRSATPKVLHTLSGRTLLDWVLRAAQAAGARRRVVVVGHQAATVRAALGPKFETVLQAQQHGTGHAVKMARSKLKGTHGDILVLCGDAPLVRPETLKRLVQTHRGSKAQATVLTARVADPCGYGRILRDEAASDQVAAIIEEREATEAERTITEINSGAYCFQAEALWASLGAIQNQNSKHEYYLTDIVRLLRQQGALVSAVEAEEGSEVLGINTRQELAQAARLMNQRTLDRWMSAGVSFQDPGTTWVDAGARIGPDSQVLANTQILGESVIGPRNQIGPNSLVVASRTGAEVRLLASVVEHAVLGNRVKVGPFAHLRPGTRLGDDVRIGNFAEINRSQLGASVKMGHMSYLGDTRVGARANIGAGTITANWDGRAKHPTVIEAEAFIGSGAVLIAPCRVGRRALVGAGAVVKARTRIPEGSLAVGVPARVIKKRKR